MKSHPSPLRAAALFLTLALAASAAHPQTSTAETPAAESTNKATESTPTPTLEQITAEPDWFARSPNDPQWLVDGSAIRYSQRRPGIAARELSDDYLIFLSSTDAPPTQISPQNPGPFFTARGERDSTGERRLLQHNGDLFLYDAPSRTTTQLTRTADHEYGAMFMADDERFAFTRSGNWYIRSLAPAGPVELQAADVRFEDKPEDPAEKRAEEIDKRDDLQKQQRELFEIIRLEDEREALSQDERHAWLDTDPTAVPGPFYLGKDRRSRGSWLSPSGRFLLVASTPSDRENTKHDTMPDYINEDGYVSTRRVRAKVGLESRTPVAFHLLDLENERAIDLDLAFLPTIADDPLAWLKDDADDNATEESGDDTDESETDDSENDDSDKPESEPEPRPVTSLGVRWSDSGRYAAFMLRSHDNKDRWIALIDTQTTDDEGNPQLSTAHHLHDEAWINWDFNDFGFVPNPTPNPTNGPETLWYLSEESNYSHLHTYDPATDTTTQLTEGDFEVRDISFTHDGSAAYMRTNRTHPGVQELEYLTLSTGALLPVTTMGGTIENYALSPDESRIVVTYSNLNQPPELYLLSFSGYRDSPPRRLTHTVTDTFLEYDFQTPEIVPIPSTNADQPIHTRVYLPDSEQFPGPRPLVIFAHGAGYLQHANHEWSGNYFREHMFHTILTNEGFIVLAPDFRASSGYGRDWRTAVYRNMGYPELEDFADCIDWAKTNHNADTDRVGIYGGSYGGFLTLMAMFLEPETYAAGAALRSVTDWRHYNHGYTANILNTPETDPHAFDISSPINHAEGLQGHLLMLHGLLDDNVVAQDIIRLSQRLIELEKQHWELALAPIEPHGYKEPSSWLDQMRRIHKLFKEELVSIEH